MTTHMKPKTAGQILRAGLKYGKGMTLELDKEERSVLKYILCELERRVAPDESGLETVYGIPGPTGFNVALFPYEVEALKRITGKLTKEKIITGGRE